jgi:hypothetical protein
MYAIYLTKDISLSVCCLIPENLTDSLSRLHCICEERLHCALLSQLQRRMFLCDVQAVLVFHIIVFLRQRA